MSPLYPRAAARLSCTLWVALCGCNTVAGEPDVASQDAGAPPGVGAQVDGSAVALDASNPPRVEAGMGGDADASSLGDAASEVSLGRDDADADARDATLAPGSYLAPCSVSPDKVSCKANVRDVAFQGGTRKVYWAAPIGAPPAAGFPLAILFQGSLFSPSSTWGEITLDHPFGGYYQGLLRVKLMEAGFVVVEPEAEGGLVWQTNGLYNYDLSTDRALLIELFNRFSTTQDFGPIDSTRLFATGISSGGYMTSRMAVSHPGKMRALAIQSGSYATCTGPLCTIPAQLPADHPPTLFLHGEADTTVGLDTAQAYSNALEKQGIETEIIVDKGVGHAWLPEAPEAVTAWFLAH